MSTLTNNYNYVSDNVVRNVLRYELKSKEEVLNGWIVVIDNKLFVNGTKGFIFPSREQAVKAVYNSLSWKAKRWVFQEELGTSWWGIGVTDTQRRQAWERFKKTLIDKYGLEFIKL